MKRDEQINFLKASNNYDVIIIGGGASALGSAVESSTRGFKTILFEAKDFANSTSSRSTKLVHGGFRYLRQGNIALVREALLERSILQKNANHLVNKQQFVIPVYNYFSSIIIFFGLVLYDLLSGKNSFGRTKFISVKNIVELIPPINKNKLKGGIIYYDGQFDDARLAINLAQTAINYGAVVLNYFKVIDILKADGKISGVIVQDQISNEVFKVFSRVVINATGIFAGEIIKLDDLNANKFLVPSQGIHLVFDKIFLPIKSALMIPKTSDGRVLFVIPWRESIIAGTTDTIVENISFEPIATVEEINFIINSLQKYFSIKIKKENIKSVFAGLRPLISDGKSKSTKDISRSHKIIISNSGLITIVGGKWTTFRKMGEDVLDKAIQFHNLEKRKSVSKNISIHGNKIFRTNEPSTHLNFYGTDKENILKLIKNSPALAEKIHTDFEFTIAEVIWAIREEMGVNIDDILARRVRLLFLNSIVAMESAEKIANILASELNWSEEKRTIEINNFKKIASTFILT